MPEFTNEFFQNMPGPTPEEKTYQTHLEERIIADYDQFAFALHDAENQFHGLHYAAKSNLNKEIKVSELRGNKVYPYLIEYLRSQGKTISPAFLENPHIKSAMANYDALIDRLNIATSLDDLEKIDSESENSRAVFEGKLYNFINSEDKFWNTALSLKGQFAKMQEDFKNSLPIDEIIRKNKERTYKTFEELLIEEGKTLADKFKKDERGDTYKHFKNSFNDITVRISKLENEQQLTQIVEEINEFLIRE